LPGGNQKALPSLTQPENLDVIGSQNKYKPMASSTDVGLPLRQMGVETLPFYDKSDIFPLLSDTTQQ
jgi:hypothetical protein